ncbi:LytR family transcriptional regulator [Arthrobacter sp. NamB2]|uniref:LCP family protein n=1 Tax=Arthrobacter sp. NamB2 TaxID=2576035 RepID=UPI0010CA1614|nr:LCP family protein [Arthrobacter sp. NamB2]TKV25714.1 LytR family transcriptional regulator [Arthrobacter sp. NamB2]
MTRELHHDSAQCAYPGEGNLVAGSSIALEPRRPRWLRLVAIAAITAVTGVVVFAGYWAIRLITNVDSFDLSAGGHRSEVTADDRTDRLQFLVLGSDTRSGPNSDHGSEDDSEGYGQSDVMMLVDISEDNTDVNVLSFPRDLLVDIPPCTDMQSGQHFDARSDAMINSAMRDAGPGCAVDTVNALTGLEVDHFMLADFHAVTELSNAVGGVEVCVTKAIDEPKSGLKLPAGTSSVQGEQALAFLRARAAFGDGGDLGRIQAQQAFLGSLARKMNDEGTLRNPQRVLAIADAVTRNLTVDKGLASVPALVTIADRLKDIDPADVKFISVPTAPAADPNRLVLDGVSAPQLFSALRASADLTAPASASASVGDTEDDLPDVEERAPRGATDSVIASAPVTLADGTAGGDVPPMLVETLRDAGFDGTQYLPAPSTPITAIYYSAGFADTATTVAATLGIPITTLAADDSIYGVQVYLGMDARGGVETLNSRDMTAAIDQTADQVSCQDTNPFG